MPTFITGGIPHTRYLRMVVWHCTRYEYSINHNATLNPKLMNLCLRAVMFVPYTMHVEQVTPQESVACKGGFDTVIPWPTVQI